MDVEMELGAHLSALLSRTGKDPKVELRDPDKLISIQMIGNLCGIGIIAKATRAKYSFVRAK
jgi:tRNA(Ser,Leu) C12 N-acetylase TAN1